MRIKLSEKYQNDEREYICNKLINIINLDDNNFFFHKNNAIQNI